MANYKCPRYIQFIETLPLNASGKVLKYELRERAHKLLGPQCNATVVLEGYGEVDVLKSRDTPSKPGPTEVRVKVAATALNKSTQTSYKEEACTQGQRRKDMKYLVLNFLELLNLREKLQTSILSEPKSWALSVAEVMQSTLSPMKDKLSQFRKEYQLSKQRRFQKYGLPPSMR